MSPPRELRNDEYDAQGFPRFTVRLTWRCYTLAVGPRSCWLAEFEDLPGYWGEGSTPESALDSLRQSLGRRPHFRVEHKMRTPTKLRADVERKHKANAAAALTIAARWGLDRGGGDAVDATAKEFSIGKSAVNAARGQLWSALSSPDGEAIGGVSKSAIEKIAWSAGLVNRDGYTGVAFEHLRLALWVAAETPWRLEHEEAKSLFPSRKGG